MEFREQQEDPRLVAVLEKIDPVLEKIRYTYMGGGFNITEPSSLQDIMTTVSEGGGEFDQDDLYLADKLNAQLYKDFPKIITNNELPEAFYTKIHSNNYREQSLNILFTNLEIVEIDTYNKLMVALLKARPNLNIKFRINYYGKFLTEERIFSNYTTEEKVEIFNQNQELVEFIWPTIEYLQSLRRYLEGKESKDGGVGRIVDCIAKIFRFNVSYPAAKKLLSPDLYAEAEKMQEKYHYAMLRDEEANSIEEKGLSVKEGHEEREKLKAKRFPDKSESDIDRLYVLKDEVYALCEKIITYVKQKMVENYENGRQQQQ